jgi:hypothetical protein
MGGIMMRSAVNTGAKQDNKSSFLAPIPEFRKGTQKNANANIRSNLLGIIKEGAPKNDAP